MLSATTFKRLFAAAAAAPLCFAAAQAAAQTTVTDSTTTPLITSSAGDVTVTATGSITVTSGAAITVDSSNDADVSGTVSIFDSSAGSSGVLVNTGAAGITSDISVGGNINAAETDNSKDNDGDGDIDGPFVADGSLRYGVRVIGTGTLTGDINVTGSIGAYGDGPTSALSIEAPVVGDISLNGTLSTRGDNSTVVNVAAPVTGDMSIYANVNAVGASARGVDISAPLDGQLVIGGQIQATGFRYGSQSLPQSAINNLDTDDKLIGGSPIRISNSITGGFLIDGPPLDHDPNNDDEDADGIPDAQEPRAVITSLGSAPVVDIGGAADLTFGNVGALADDQFGLEIRGVLQGQGIYDNVSTTGVSIGGHGGAVDLTDGIHLTGSILTNSPLADTTGVHLFDGVSAPTFKISGGAIVATSIGDDTVSPVSTAVQIDSGATVNTLINSGTISAGVSGPTGSATAVLDGSGQVTSVTNTGVISARVVSSDLDVAATGDTIALDLRASTSGVTVTQSANTDPATTPDITGDILFGAGSNNDTLAVSAGKTNGAVAFGDGDDALSVSGATTSVTADLSKGAGSLTIGVASGALGLTNTTEVDVTSLNVGSGATLSVALDPANDVLADRHTFLNVGGAATFADGSLLGLTFKSKLVEATETYTLLSAGSLIDSGLSDTLDGNLPVLFTGSVAVGANDISVTLRRSTAAELGLTGAEADAFEAFYTAFDADPAVAARILSKTTSGGFDTLYRQFLPDYSGGPFRVISETTRQGLSAQAETPTSLNPGEPRSWLQEVGVTVKQESVADVPYETGGFGLIGGIERPMYNGYVGLSFGYQSSEIRNDNRSIGSVLAASAVTGGLYYRQTRGALVLDSDVSLGYAWINSARRIIDEGSDGTRYLTREADARWGGLLAAARVGATYNYESGHFYVRPSAVLDGVYLSEGGYTETGAGDSVNLTVKSRTTYETAAEVNLVVGARFGRAFKWGPEFTIGYRSVLASQVGQTSAAFAATPGTDFVLTGIGRSDGLLIVRAALRGQGTYSALAFEAGGEIGDTYEAYMARVLLRFLF